jgi:hypothetical protein
MLNGIFNTETFDFIEIPALHNAFDTGPIAKISNESLNDTLLNSKTKAVAGFVAIGPVSKVLCKAGISTKSKVSVSNIPFNMPNARIAYESLNNELSESEDRLLPVLCRMQSELLWPQMRLILRLQCQTP